MPVDPDFVCEVLSPSNKRYDLTKKQAAYQVVGVPWLWHLDPDERHLTVMKHSPEGYVIVMRGVDGETLRLPPFDAIEIEVSGLFPPLPPDMPPR